ncbi:MAG TPA: tetratricopeptide repeat protein [Candidatus Methylacidiphilales bacterium]|nr:tetratricopeptide repeat protein [Candidatus Methylacidiphilales bacterium]
MAKQFMSKSAADEKVSTPRPAARRIVSAPPLPEWLNRDWLWGLVLILAVILTYTPVWWAGYIWDDDINVTADPCIVGPFGLREIWTTHAGQFFPLVLTTFWMEHALWGLAPLPYHLMNVLLHAACAVLLWRVLRNLRIPGAWLGAALWALHPLQVESVAWVSEMKNTQSGLFYLLSILFFVRWLKTRGTHERNSGGWNYPLTLLFAALAMASKSSTVVLPGVLCLCAWWIEGRWQWRNLAKVVPILLMSAVAAALSMWSYIVGTPTIADPPAARGWPERAAAAGDVIWFYLGKLVWPHPLMTIYPRWQINAGQGYSYLPLLAVIIVLSILWFKRESWSRPWFFALAYFLVAVSPFLTLIDQGFWRYSFVEDHLQYLAAMGPLALAGAGLIRLADWAFPERRTLQSTLYAILLLILGGVSWQRIWVYESQETLWIDALIKNPNCPETHDNFGMVLFQEGRVDEAMVQFKKALEIDPNYADAHNNFGWALFQKGQADEAIAQYQQALKINPHGYSAHCNLGTALLQKGQLDEAMDQFQMALRIDPTIAAAHINLGWALFQKGRVDEAVAQYQKALKINPHDYSAHYNLGTALLQKGQADGAIAQFQEALRLKPNSATAQDDLAKAEAILRQQVQEKQ